MATMRGNAVLNGSVSGRPEVGVFQLNYSREHANSLLLAFCSGEESEQGSLLREFLDLYRYHVSDGACEDDDGIRALKKQLLGPDGEALAAKLLERIPSKQELRPQIEKNLLEQFYANYQKCRRPRDVMEEMVKRHAPEYDYDRFQIRTVLLKRFILGAGFGCATIPIESLALYCYSNAEESWQQDYQQAAPSRRLKLLADSIENDIFHSLSSYQLNHLQSLQVLIKMLEFFKAETEAAPKNEAFLTQVDLFCEKLAALFSRPEQPPLEQLTRLLALIEQFTRLGQELLGPHHPSLKEGKRKAHQPRYFTVDGFPFTDLTVSRSTVTLVEELGVPMGSSVLDALRAVEIRFRHDLNAGTRLSALMPALEKECGRLFRRMSYPVRDEACRGYSGLTRALLFRDLPLGKKTRQNMRKFVRLGGKTMIDCLEEISLQCRPTSSDPDLASLMACVAKDVMAAMEEHRSHRRLAAQATVTEGVGALYRTAVKDEKVRLAGKVGALLGLCDDLAAGRFKADKIQNRKNCYHTAAVLGLNQEEVETLLTCYYNDDLLRYLEDETVVNKRRSSFEAEPSGAGVNYKNFAECILCYYILKPSALTPGQRLDKAYQSIKACKEQFAKRFEAEVEEEILTWEEEKQRKLNLEERMALRTEAENELDQASLYTYQRRLAFMDEILPIPTRSMPSIETYVTKKYPIPKLDEDEFLASADLRKLDGTVLELETELLACLDLETGAQQGLGLDAKKKYHATDRIYSVWSEINVLGTRFRADPALRHLWREESFTKTLSKLHERLSRPRNFYLSDEVAAMAAVLLALKAAKEGGDPGMTTARLHSKLAESSSGIKSSYTDNKPSLPMHTDKFLTRILKVLREHDFIEKKGNEYCLSHGKINALNWDEESLIFYLEDQLPSPTLNRTMLVAVYTAYYVNVELPRLQKALPQAVFYDTVRDDFIRGLSRKLDDCRFAPFHPDYLIDSYALLALELHVILSA